MDYNTLKWVVRDLPVVQLKPVQPAAQEVHDPSLCRHVSGLQFGEHFRERPDNHLGIFHWHGHMDHCIYALSRCEFL